MQNLWEHLVYFVQSCSLSVYQSMIQHVAVYTVTAHPWHRYMAELKRLATSAAFTGNCKAKAQNYKQWGKVKKSQWRTRRSPIGRWCMGAERDHLPPRRAPNREASAGAECSDECRCRRQRVHSDGASAAWPCRGCV